MNKDCAIILVSDYSSVAVILIESRPSNLKIVSHIPHSMLLLCNSLDAISFRYSHLGQGKEKFTVKLSNSIDSLIHSKKFSTYLK